MNKKVSIKRTSAIFLATVILVAGIIGTGLYSPLNSYGEIYKNAKCDNTNVNINGIDQEQIQRQDVTNDLGTENTGLTGQELTPEEAMNALSNGNGNGEPLLNIVKNIVNVCINDNENELTGIFTGEQNQAINPLTCEECFTTVLDENQLMQLQDFLSAIGVVDLNGFCELLSDPTVPNENKLFAVLISLIVGAGVEDVDQLNRILECLENIGLINLDDLGPINLEDIGSINPPS